MGDAITAAFVANGQGLAALEQGQRLLLVRAGSLEWFGKLLETLQAEP